MADVIFDQLVFRLPVNFSYADAYSFALYAIGADPDPSIDTLDALAGSGAVEVAAASYFRPPMTSAAVAPDATNHRGLIQADAISFGALESGFNYDRLVLFHDDADDSVSWPLIAYDLGAGGFTTDGDAVNVSPAGAGYWTVRVP